MKPNVLVFQPLHADEDPAIDLWCETLCETHYVYVIRPIGVFREDSPAGVRFLNYSTERLPGFGDVESVIVVDSAELRDRLENEYPGARQWLWNRGNAVKFPDLVPLSKTVIPGDFQQAVSDRFELAM